MMRFLVAYETPSDPAAFDMDALKAAFASPEGQATAADAASLPAGGVRSVFFEVDEVFSAG